jgi:hypothetical protein
LANRSRSRLKLGDKSVWYRWVAPASGAVYVTIFVGTKTINLAFIAFNDDDGGLATSAIIFNAVPEHAFAQ